MSIGALAFLSAGHTPGKGQYGETVQKALDYVVRNAKPSGLLNIAGGHDMYNHGLSCFVLGQAYGMTSDARVGPVLDRGLKLIVKTQCRDGGWDYSAASQQNGHDLSLAVMQAKALRSAVDSGLEVPPEVIAMAIRSVREHYTPQGCAPNAPEAEQKKYPGRFTYSVGGGNATPAMAAAGVVCMQEFAQYDDWRIEKNMQVLDEEIRQKCNDKVTQPPFDAYTLYYIGQATYQAGGARWKHNYPLLRNSLVASQVKVGGPDSFGSWPASGQVGGKPGQLYQTAVSCFILAMPNRFLPILQEGKIEGLRQQLQKGKG